MELFSGVLKQVIISVDVSYQAVRQSFVHVFDLAILYLLLS